MGKVCGECLYYKIVDVYESRCKKRHRSVECLDEACSQFVSEDQNTCLECAYSEAITGGLFVKDDDYRCTRNNKKVKMDTVACRYFVG
jgi:hypothetical protein